MAAGPIHDIVVPESEVIAWRRHIHHHPELSYQETATARFVTEILSGLAVYEIAHPTETSVVATVRGGAGNGKTVALRADIDALPVSEETGLDFASDTPGVMHACGHDAHTAMLLGTATVLAGLHKQLAGKVKLVFQHAEESPPGGAQELVAGGVLDGVDAIFGLHIMNQKTGTIEVSKGPSSTSADGFYLTIKGRGAHSSMPQTGLDPVLVGDGLDRQPHTHPVGDEQAELDSDDEANRRS